MGVTTRPSSRMLARPNTSSKTGMAFVRAPLRSDLEGAPPERGRFLLSGEPVCLQALRVARFAPPAVVCARCGPRRADMDRRHAGTAKRGGTRRDDARPPLA